MNESEKNMKLRLEIYRWMLCVLIVLVLAASVAFGFSHFLIRYHARTALYHARSVRLAAWSYGMESYASGTDFIDLTTESGFADGMLEKILDTADCDGDIRVMKVSDSGYEITDMDYTEGNYTVELRTTDGEAEWTVYRRSTVLSP